MSSRDQEEFVAGFIEQEAALQLWIQFTLMNGQPRKPAYC